MFKHKSQRHAGAALTIALASALMYPLALGAAHNLIWISIAFVVAACTLTLVTK